MKVSKVFDGECGVKVLCKKGEKCWGETHHQDIIHINQDKGSMGWYGVNKEWCICIRRDEVQVMMFLPKMMKPSMRLGRWGSMKLGGRDIKTGSERVP